MLVIKLLSMIKNMIRISYQATPSAVEHECDDKPRMRQRPPGTEATPPGLGRCTHQGLRLPRHGLHVLTHIVTRLSPYHLVSHCL